MTGPTTATGPHHEQDGSALRTALRRAVEFAFEDAKQMGSYPSHSHLGLPFWDFEEFTDSVMVALRAEHPPVLAALPPSAPPGLDVEVLAKALRTHYRDHPGAGYSHFRCAEELADEYARLQEPER